jgi:hypothetical protein
MMARHTADECRRFVALQNTRIANAIKEMGAVLENMDFENSKEEKEMRDCVESMRSRLGQLESDNVGHTFL